MSETVTAVSGAALDRGRELRAAGEYAEALAVFAAMLDRLDLGQQAVASRDAWRPADEIVAAVVLGGSEADWVRAAGLVTAGDPGACETVARTLLNAAECLIETKRRNLAIDIYRKVLDRFGSSAEPSMQPCIARALWSLALNLDKDGRPEQGLDALRTLVVRFIDTEDERLSNLAAAGLGRKAIVLMRIGRKEEAVATYRELAARRVEAISPQLANLTGHSLITVAAHAAQAHQTVETLAVVDDLLERFPQPDTARLRANVATGLYLKGVALNEMGESDQALAVYRELIGRFADDEQVMIRAKVVDAMLQEAAIIDQDGSRDEAEEALDQTLTYLADATEPELVRKRIHSLVSRAELLDQTGREAEELVVHHNLVQTYLALDPGDRDHKTLERVIWSVLTRARVVDELHPRTSALVDQLVVVLSDVTEPGASESEPKPGLVPDAEIAGLLAELYQRPFWFEFATSSTDPAGLEAMQETALLLYDRTAGWLQLTGGDHEAPAFVAAMLIRQIADGYALLAHPWTTDQKTGLNLPLAIAVEWAIREAHLDEWATGHGHPLELSDSQELAEELIRQNAERVQGTDPDYVTRLMISVRRYQMLLKLCDSPAGRAALNTPQMRSLIDQQLDHTRTFAAHFASHHQDAAGLGVLCVLIAEAYFVASRTPLSSSQDVFPSPAFARQLLTHSDAYRWMDGHGIELPGLLAE